jgi:hypothetical protein
MGNDASMSPAETRHTAGYSLGSAIVDVDTDTAETGRWLRGFLAPWMDVTGFGGGDVLVRFTCSQAAFDDLERRSASVARLMPCFALDRRLVALPGWDDGESLMVADRDFGCFYQIHERRVDIVGRPGERRAELGLMRVVREILAARRLASGRLLDLHAAAFEVGQRAVLIAGVKRSGKTTLLCYALASGRARLIANDRVFVEVDGGDSPEVSGIPAITTIRPDTLRLFPRLRKDPDGPPPSRDIHLSPAHLAERLGASCVPAAPLSVIVFPDIAGDTDTWTVDALSTADAVARLGACFYGARQKDPTVLEAIGGPLPRRAEPAGMARRLAERVRFFRCRLGPRAYARDAGEWFSAIGIDAAGDPTGR